MCCSHTLQRTARISIVINSDWGIPLNRSFTKDVAAAEPTGDYPEVMRERIGDRLPNFTEEQSAQLKGSYDLLMLNYYASYATTGCDLERSETNCSSLTLGWATDLGVDDSRNPDGARHAYGSIMDADSCSADSGYPPGYIQAIRFLHEHDTNADILLTENGWCGNETIDTPTRTGIFALIWSKCTRLFTRRISQSSVTRSGASWMASSGPITLDVYTALPTQLTRIQRSAGAWYPNVATTGCFEQEEEDEQYLV
ncbi:uncharacterized protein PITG_16493 [Phytophthora infestans T30-4]|uniref:Glycoside hydrolase n=1 Tax=Phytophthora infestans (strain T30-4) TaxID=403677 RepID=D0NTS4_PHYIT|nr:uncharacterized protein PITG_16493 [Phytophthora infestans T30-4]EEY65036.1 conserved hypothetical protein [Phytophthora infestans T30-4]|eukprot:XP_002897524.1 conserved hypothetical protein [Phytophthora infestans T30-4]